MRRAAGLLSAVVLALVLASAGPAAAQSFFERLFRAQPQPAPPPSSPPQYAPPAQPQQRRAPQLHRPSRSQTPQNPPQQQAATPAPEPPPAPYEKDLLRLSEIIGSLAFLRSLCANPDATEWPQRMQALLDAEGTTQGRKERLAGAYNKGYQAFALTYRICTDSATEATNRYVREGDQLSRNLAGRYGG
jgi:uncharacterized protein (TIGR02301 family)